MTVKGRFLVNTSSLSVMAWNVLVASWMLRPGVLFPHFCTVFVPTIRGISGWGFGPPKTEDPVVC